MTTYCVMRNQKVNNQRQTWGVYKKREGVSATVWDEMDIGMQHLPPYKGRGFYSMAAAIHAVERFELTGTWQGHTGRGSAYWTVEGL